MILIVEDQHDTRAALVRLVMRAGHEAVGVANGPQALLILKTALPRLVILDHRMPLMDGLEVLRQIREEPRTAAVPVVFHTAEESGLLRADAIAAGAQDYVRKGSMEWTQLVACFERHMTPAEPKGGHVRP